MNQPQLMDTSLARQFDRLPPHSIEGEMCMLASMMIGDVTLHAEITSIVDRSMLFQADHQIIFEVICDLRASGKPVDAVILREELAGRQLLDEVGGTAYLAQILATVPSAGHGAHYAGIVREKSLLRSLISAANDCLRDCYAPRAGDFAEELVQDTIGKLTRLLETGKGNQIHPIGEILGQVYEQMEGGGAEMTPMGFYELDDAAGGGAGIGEMIVIAGRPSMGKSTLAKQIALRSALQGIPAGIISLEEGRFKIGRNILSAECQIENHRIRKAKMLSAQDWQRLADGVTRLGKIPLYVVDSVRRISDIRNAATIMAARHGIKLLIVDYLQRVKGIGGRDRYEQVSNTSTELSDLFKEVGVAGIAVAQLNRGPENRDDKRPMMSDLRDSGQIEQDADGIIFLHREDYYHLDDGSYQPTGIAEAIIAKWRDGIRGKTVKLASDLKFQTFHDLAAIPESLLQL